MLASVSASALNVRAVPTINAHIMGILQEGAVVKILGSNDDWYEIPFHQTSGFVSKHYMEAHVTTATVTGLTTASLLNVRQHPSAAGRLLGTLSKGTRIEVSSHLNDWLEIEFNNDIAYVSANYVELFSNTPSMSVEVVTDLLNVRSAPGLNSSILGHVSAGSQLQIIQAIDLWLEFMFNGNKAYVHKNYVRTLQRDDAPPIVVDGENDDDEDIPSPSSLIEPSSSILPMQTLPVRGSAEQKKVSRTWNNFGGLLTSLSDEKHIDVACAVSVLCVESSGKGFEQNNQNRMIIRFENHKFWKYWGRAHPHEFKQHFQYQSGKVWKGHQWRPSTSSPWQTFHGNQQKEWQVFEFARSIDADAAMLSISMGAPQIMGFHYQRIGYRTVAEMFDSFSSDIAAHINGLFDFFSNRMIGNLQQLEFENFAAGYNGSGQKQKYGHWIANHYHAFKKIQRNLS